MLPAAAVVAVGAAAVAFVAGVGTYLYIRFTQHRRESPQGGEASPRPQPPPRSGSPDGS